MSDGPIVFLCTGNYYRSRFAEIWLNHQAPRRGLGVRADSRGLDLKDRNVGPMSPHALRGLRARAIDPGAAAERFPRWLEQADLDGARQVIAVCEDEHRPLMARRFPAWVDRISYWTIYDLDRSTAEPALASLERHLARLLDELAAQDLAAVAQSG